MRGPGGVKNSKVKEQTWEEVAKAVNAVSETVQRSTEEARKQYANIKQRAKEKSDAMRRPSTGGGPKPPSPTPVELEMLNSMEDRPTLCGLSSGYDTEEVILGIIPSTCAFTNNDENCTENFENTSQTLYATSVQPVTYPTGSSSTVTKRRKTMEDEEILTLRAEREKYLEEVKKLKEESDYYKVKTMNVSNEESC
uniref:Uncharacterized protein LOC111132456 n=1 Tax=Crassostrea virginica TaxID=6565 RepID=A0A8B8EW86_CRAVI|nr:uncharacterized protein LOC111132456 [Crassostrea virginica]XP_022344192.1 uncharacterized protein LOC111137164 [Crassostrea virginica]